MDIRSPVKRATYRNDPVHLLNGKLKVYTAWTVAETADQGQIAGQAAVLARLGRLDPREAALVVYRTLKGLSLRKRCVRDVELESPGMTALAGDPVDVAGGQQSTRLDPIPRTKPIRSVAIFL